MHLAYVALGANLADPATQVRAALAALAAQLAVFFAVGQGDGITAAKAGQRAAFIQMIDQKLDGYRLAAAILLAADVILRARAHRGKAVARRVDNYAGVQLLQAQRRACQHARHAAAVLEHLHHRGVQEDFHAAFVRQAQQVLLGFFYIHVDFAPVAGGDRTLFDSLIQQPPI